MKKHFIYGIAASLLLVAVVFLASCTGENDGTTSTAPATTKAIDATTGEGTTDLVESGVTVDASGVPSATVASGKATTSSGKSPKPSGSLTEVPILQTENNKTTSHKTPATAATGSSGGIEVQTGDIDEGWY